MAYKKKTLRVMSPTARKVARLIGEQESVAKRLKNLVPDLQRLDLDSRALQTATQPNVTEGLKRILWIVDSLTAMKYQEIHNVDAINHTLDVINEHIKTALGLLG